jgi:phosphoglycerol transferase MdoB-like AlkP superfamily enzyme
MKKRLLAFSGYALFWMFFFFTARLFFILTHYKEAFQFDPGTIAATFSHGILLDFSATGYFFLLPVLVALPGLFFNGEWYRLFIKWYTYILLLISSVVIVGDTVLYKYWGFRMDHTPLVYLKTPKEAVASASNMESVAVPFAIIMIVVLFIYLYNKVIDKLFHDLNRVRYLVPSILVFVVMWAALIIPIRGGFGIAPINAGTVYFNENTFVNHTAINVVWNFGSSVINGKPTKNPYIYTEPDNAKALTLSLLEKKGITENVLKEGTPNILFIVLESFGSALIGPMGGDTLTTPCFNSYIDKGIFFSNIYASGNRTDKAMPAILNGYPAQPAESIMKEPKKTQSLTGIVKTLTADGFSSSFWYGGEINFANFNSFVINAGFKDIVTMKNFDPVNYNSKWGVHDNVLLAALKDSMQSVKEPFVKVVLTLSSHEPFEVPMEPVFAGVDELTKFRNSIYYADKTLGDFLDWAGKSEWWKNTLVILVADHCRRNSSDVPAYSEEIFRIPMLWLGGALAKEGIKIEKYGSQTDIPVTILNQLKKNVDFPFGKDLLSDGSNSFAFYTFNEGFGFITDSSKYIYDHKLGAPVVNEGRNPEVAGEYGKAYLQVLFDDFLKR